MDSAMLPEKGKTFALARGDGGNGPPARSPLARLIAIVEAATEKLASFEARLDGLELRPLARDGRGIAAARLNPDGELVLTLSDGIEFNVGHVMGKDGSSSAPIAVLQPENGTDGASVVSATIDENGNLILALSDGRKIEAGRVRGTDGEDGKNADPAMPPKDGVGITSAAQNDDGELLLILSDGRSLNAGRVRGKDGEPGSIGLCGDAGAVAAHIEQIEINADGNLLFSFSDGRKFNAGLARGKDGRDGDAGQSIKGEAGESGRSVSLAEIDDKGRLCIHLSDGIIQIAGRVVGRDGEDGHRGPQGDLGPTGPSPSEDELVRLIANVRQSAEIADAAAGLKTVALAVEMAVQSLTAPKRIVRDKHGRPVGIEPVPPEEAA